MTSRRSRCGFAALVLTVSAAWLACGDDGERTGANGEAAQRLRTGQIGTEATSGQSQRAALQRMERMERMQQRHRERFDEVDLTADQQRRLDEFDADQRVWQAEHRDAVRALLDEMTAARRAGDTAALEDSRSRMRALRETMPTLRGIIAELSDEQRAQLGQLGQLGENARGQRSERLEKHKQAAALRRQQRFAGVELSEDQQRRLDGMDDARRVWQAEHSEELHALQAEIRAAAESGDGAAAAAARNRIQELRATAPSLRSILAELSDEQRAQIRARRAPPRQLLEAGDASAPVEKAPDDPVAR